MKTREQKRTRAERRNRSGAAARRWLNVRRRELSVCAQAAWLDQLVYGASAFVIGADMIPRHIPIEDAPQTPGAIRIEIAAQDRAPGMADSILADVDELVAERGRILEQSRQTR